MPAPVLPSLFVALLLAAALLFILNIFRTRKRLSTELDAKKSIDGENIVPAIFHSVQHGLILLGTDDRHPLLHNLPAQETANHLGWSVNQLAAGLAAHHAAMKKAVPVGPFSKDLEAIFNENLWNEKTLVIQFTPTRYQGMDATLVSFREKSNNQPYDIGLAIRTIHTPMNTMLGHMEFIDQLEFSADQRKRWAAVRIASSTLMKQIADISDYCNLEKDDLLIECMEFDAGEMLARSIAPLTGMAALKNIKIHVHIKPFAILIHNDQKRISQILEQLLLNAIQFTRDGKILVRLEHQVLDAEHSMLQFVVEDSGVGIPPELHEEIFTPFMSTARHSGHVGLGLAICKRLCDKLGAKISVSCMPGTGSRFSVKIPCSPHLANDEKNTAYRGALSGHSVVFISPSVEWHDCIVPHLAYWGLKVYAYDHPGSVDANQIRQASCVIFFESDGQWCAEAENRVIAEASHIIECNSTNPLEIIKMGRTTLLCCYSLNSLFNAFLHVTQSDQEQHAASPKLKPPPSPSTLPPSHVMEAFQKSLQASLQNIRLAISSDEPMKVVQELHNLSGSLAVFGAPEFSSICIQLESSIKLEGLPSNITALENLTHLLMNEPAHEYRDTEKSDLTP